MEDTKIRSYLQTFYDQVEMPGGFRHDLVDTIKRIDLYYLSQFKNGNKDSRGRRKPFLNENKTPIDVARKFVDIDMKDVLAYNENPGEDQEWKVWLMIQQLKRWLKKNDFGVFMNELVDDYPKYGHVFIKKSSDGKWHSLRIHNLRFDPSSQNFSTDVWFTEITQMSRAEIIAAKEEWSEKENIQRLLEQNEPSYVVYICHIRNDEGGWDREYKAGLFDRKANGKILRGTEALLNTTETFEPAFTLHKDNLSEKDFNYRELKWEDIPGRRLGYGFGEYLFENQINTNEIAYLEKIALHLKALQLFTTADPSVGGNLLQDAESGDVIRTAVTLSPVQKDNSDLSAFAAAHTRWSQNAERKTFSYDASRGENSPSGTPLGLAQINVGQITSFFDGKKEKLGLFLEKLLLDDVIPSFKKENSKEHMMSILSTAARVEKFMRWYARQEVDRQAMEWAMGEGGGFFPDEASRKQEVERVFAELIRRKSIPIQIPASYYNDAKFLLRINIVGENESPATADTIVNLIQGILSNPATMQNPITRTLGLRAMEMKGMSPIDLELLQEMAQEQPQIEGQLPTGSATAAPQASAGAMPSPTGGMPL